MQICNASSLPESNWNAIQETLYLISIPGMAETIITGMNTRLSECSQSLFDECFDDPASKNHPQNNNF
jgi:hypothetical protein